MLNETDRPQYMLEITMESLLDTRIKRYIRRSFPVKKGTLSINRFGYPFDKYGSVEIGELFIEGNIVWLSLIFDGEEIKVSLNQFETVQRNYEFMEYRASIKHFVVIHTTFYLYIE